MADEKELVEGQATETEAEEQPTGSNQTQKQGTFTQEDVNKIVAKEKAAWKRAQDKTKGDWTEAEQALRDQIAARDEVITKQVNLLKKDLELDEITVELLADKDPLEQFNLLVKIMDKQGRKDIP